MIENVQVSVVIPTHNRGHLIRRAIDSAVGQTYGNLQIVIVDDCSNDATKTEAAGCNDRRVEYFRHNINCGGSAARNTGIRKSRGEYIAFLDDDDEWMPNKIEMQLAVFNETPAAGMVYTGRHYVDDDTGMIIKTVKADKSGTLFNDLLKSNCIGTTSSAMIKKDCFEKTGMFDEGLSGCQDWDLWIRIAKYYLIGCVPEPLVRFHIHDIRMTSNLEAKIRAKRLLLQKILTDIGDDKRTLSHHHLVLGKIYCQINDFAHGKQELANAMKLFPWNPDVYKYYIPALLGERFYKYISQLSANNH